MRKRRWRWGLGRGRDTLPMGYGSWSSVEVVSAILDDDVSRWGRLRWRLRYLLKRPPFDGRPSQLHFAGGGGIVHGDLGVSQAGFETLAGSLTEAQTSPLVRVIAIGQQAEAAGVRIELIAWEVRESGAVLYWRAFAPSTEMLGLAVMEVADEHGRVYNAWPGGGEGGEFSCSGRTNIVPALAAGTGILRIKVTRLESFMPTHAGEPSRSEGPWAFEVSLVNEAR